VFIKKSKTNKSETPKKDNVLTLTLKPFGWVWKGLKSFGRYFRDSWKELRQVRWPNRRATWGLTLAVIGFSIFFVILIILLDLGFQKLFELILK